MKYKVEGIITNVSGLFGYDAAAFRFDDNHVFTVLLPHDENARYGDKVKLTATKEETK